MKDLKKNFLILFKRFWPFLVIFAVSLIFFWKVFIRGYIPLPADFVVGVYYPWLDYKWGYSTGVPVKNPLTTDVVSFTYPMQTLAIDLLKRGISPLWNSYILAGTPLLANFQSAPFSPTNIVYFLFDKLTAWSVQIILQHILAAVFTYLLLRFWKVSKIGSIFGGILFAFSGFNLIWSQWNGHTLAAAFIPLIILFVDKFLKDKGSVNGIAISLSLAFLFYSGYPQVALYLALAIVIIWLLRIWKDKKWLVKTSFLGIYLLLGIGLSMAQILPGVELLSLSQREVEPHPYEWAFLPWSKIITFVAPDYYGNHATQNYWGPQDYTSNTGFVGVIAMVFAVISLPLIRSKKELLFAFILMGTALAFAFPTPISLFLWKSGFLGFNAASAHRSLVLFNLSIALLAAYGVDYFLDNKIKVFRSLSIPFTILLVFGGYAILFYFLSKLSPDIYPPLVRGIAKYTVALRNLIFPFGIFILTAILLFVSNKFGMFKKIAIYLLFALMVFELFRFGWKFTPFSPRHIVFPNTPILDFLISVPKPVRITGSRVIPINMRMPYKLESLEGYDAVYPLSISKFIAAINSEKSGTDPVGRYGTIDNITSHLMDITNTKYYLAIKRSEKGEPSASGEIPSYFDQKRFKIVFEDKSVAILENLSVLPRAFIVYDWAIEKEDNKILDLMLDVSFPIKSKIVLREDPYIRLNNSATENSVEYLNYDVQESLISVSTNADGLLFISDTYYPGWKAYVDGKETKIYRANYAFRAIVVPKGFHKVMFSYEPESFYSGVKLSLVSLVMLFLLYHHRLYLSQ